MAALTGTITPTAPPSTVPFVGTFTPYLSALPMVGTITLAGVAAPTIIVPNPYPSSGVAFPPPLPLYP